MADSVVASPFMQPNSPYQSPATFEPPPYLTNRSNLTLTTKQILFSFDGRIPRRTYWKWSILSVFFTILPLILLIPLLESDQTTLQVVGFILLVPLIVTFIWSGLAVRVKRWHDHEKSWVWLLISMIPYAGVMISFMFLGCMRGTVGHNRYGDDPT